MQKAPSLFLHDHETRRTRGDAAEPERGEKLNPYERKYDELRKLNQLWAESEWRLNMLRTISPTPLPDPTPEQLEQWKQHIRKQH